VVQTLCEILDECLPGSEHSPHESLVEYVTDRPGHDRRYAMDITKINRDLGWSPQVSLSEGLLKTVDWYLQNQDWVAAIGAQGDYQDWLEKNYQARGGKI
jgi:dTDP-glucose 4,6-dehydratase